MKEVRDYYNRFDVCREREIPFCADACPFRLDILDIRDRIAKKRFNAAYKTLRDALVFPEIVSRICPAYCQEACIRKIFDDPVQLRTLEQSVIALASRKDPNAYNLPQKDARIAVIGAGISGMAFALKMASRKYSVTVFEKAGRVGGSLDLVLDEEIYTGEFELQFMHESYSLQLNREIKSLSELADFDAIYVATGAGGESFGLTSSYNEILSPQGKKTGVFTGGSLNGKDLMHALADGARMALCADNYIKTGLLEEIPESPETGCVPNKDLITETKAVEPSSDVYTEAEAVAEAERCIKCRCDGCESYCDLVAFYSKSPIKMRDEVFLSVKPAGSLVHKSPARKYIAACTQCRIMEENACPEHIELCSMIKAAKHQMHAAGKMPAAYKQYFVRDTEFANGPEASLVKDFGTKAEYAFFPGCSLGALNPDFVIKPYKWILDKYPDSGILLECCNVPLDWAGSTEAHSEAMNRLRTRWEALGKPKLITACLSCERHLTEYLPEAETVTLYELMAEHGETGESGLKKDGQVYSVFDPCAARGRDSVQKAVRELASQTGYETVDLPKKDMHGCCGFGGQGAVAQPEFTDYVAGQRLSMSENPYLVYCANCYDVFAGKGRDTLHVLNILFDIEPEPLPDVTMRRRNRINLKERLLKEIWEEEMESKPKEEKYTLVMTDDVARKVEAQRILAEDICNVIERSEETGRRTRNPENGHYKAYNEIGAITLWVEYGDFNAPENGRREIFNVYSHRMQIKLEAVFNGKKIDG